MHNTGWLVLLLSVALVLWTQICDKDEVALDGAVVVAHNPHRQDTPMSTQSSSSLSSSSLLRPNDYRCVPCDDDTLEQFLPQFAIIGAMKSGTSALAKYLRNHPSVGKGKGEAHILDNHKWFIHDSRNTTIEQCRILQAYKAFFSNQLEVADDDTTHPVLFDKSPNYLLESHIIPTRLVCAMTARRTKLVVILRHPVDRAFSQYQHQMRNAERYRRESFEQMVQRDLGNLQEAGVQPNSKIEDEYRAWVHYRKLKGTSAIGRGLYVIQLRQWFAVLQETFGKENLLNHVLVVESEAMLQDRQGYFDKVLDFVDLPSLQLPDQDNGIRWVSLFLL